jgi:fatty-acid desaturase
MCPKTACSVVGCQEIHYSHGYCRKHWAKNKYDTDPVFREARKKSSRKCSKKYYYKMLEEDPKWNTKRQKKYRKMHKDKFNYIQCRYYFRRLTCEQRLKMITDVMKEEHYGKNIIPMPAQKQAVEQERA